MAEFKEVAASTIPFEKHPLYSEAMQKARDGDEGGAVAALRRLAELYPKEQFIKDLLLRFQLRTTFSTEEYISVDHTQGAPALRTMVLLMLAVTACLVIITASIAAYNRRWPPGFWNWIEIDGDGVADVEIQWSDLDRRVTSGDYGGAREILDGLATRTPDDPRIEETRQTIDWLESCYNLYADAVKKGDEEQWQVALDLAYQIPAECPNPDRNQRLIEDLQGMAALEAAWQEVQGLVQAEDWQSAVSTLDWIRTRNPKFRRVDVENLLYQIHRRLGLDLINTAYGNLDLLRQAISHLSEALALRFSDRELDREKQLAVGFVAGSEAFARGDWVAAVERWEKVYEESPGYQGSALERNLFEAYPRAAKQLISESKGSERLLDQALGFLDEALRRQPDDEELLEERHLVTEYLNGLDAYRQESWDLAIAQWGAIHALRPDFLDGVLEEKLDSACASSESPDATFCLRSR